MSIDAMRRQYDIAELTEADAGLDPHALFQRWFVAARQSAPTQWYEANAMTLATTAPDGTPDARIVLLKDITPQGLTFYTNYTSAKAQQIADQPCVTCVLHWPWLEQQVRITGPASPVARDVSEQYFATRPRGSQLGAWVSEQSTPTTREHLAQRLAQLEADFAGQAVPCPPNWGGYLITPTRYEFWQGRPNRLHDRLQYTRQNQTWQRQRLAP